MIADAIKDVNWFDIYFPPVLKSVLIGVFASFVAVYLFVKILSWLGLPKEKSKFMIEAIEAIKALFGK